MIFKWNEMTPPRYKQYDAQSVGERIVMLSKRNGGKCTSVTVLADAKNVESPLHRLFEWDNDKAATEYRKHQAKEIAHHIISIRVSPRGQSEERPLLQSVTVSHSDGREHGAFVTGDRSRQDPNFRRQLVKRALQELAAWCNRYGELDELQDVNEAIAEHWPEWGVDFVPANHKKSAVGIRAVN